MCAFVDYSAHLHSRLLVELDESALHSLQIVSKKNGKKKVKNRQLLAPVGGGLIF
jgi:hypothetical protein